MSKKQDIEPADFTSVYKDIAEVIGVDATIALHKCFQGQQITLPKKLYTQKYIIEQVNQEEDTASIKSIASQFGYTERRLRQIIKEQNYERQEE